MKFSSTAAAGDPQVIDLAILAALLGYDQDKVRKFALKFLHTTRVGLDEMQACLSHGDVARTRELGHRIKSAARAVGALGLADLCHELENMPSASPEAEEAGARAILARLRPLLDQVARHIMQNTTLADGA